MAAFLVVGGIGLALLLVALLFGEVLDGLLPHVELEGGGGLFSTEVVGSFLAAFGFTAALLDGSVGGAVAALGGIGAGVLMAAGALALSRSLLNMRTDPTPRTRDLVGSVGVIVTGVPDHGLGEVVVSHRGNRVKLNARADAPLASGTNVVVVDVTSPTSVVVTESGFETLGGI
ncbi:MAG: hypothetical protein H0V19_02310 [Euzebyales bacterium]|nr:hypothetical protein [Euzebyales bacterium]